MKKMLISTIVVFSLLTALIEAQLWAGQKIHLDGANLAASPIDSSGIITGFRRFHGFSISNLTPEYQLFFHSLKTSASQNFVAQLQDSGDAVKNDNPNNEVVVVEGFGNNMEEAKKDAIRNAVEQVVGALVDAQTRVDNDQLIEQILTASGAYIEESEVLSSNNENGMVTIKLRATVIKMSLSKDLKITGMGQTIAVDGTNLYDSLMSKVDSEKNGALFLANFLKNESFPYNLIDIKVCDKYSITQKENKVVLTFSVETSINLDRYFDFAKRVKPIFDKYAIQKSSFLLETCNENDEIKYSHRKVPIEKNAYEGSDFSVCICTGAANNFSSLEFERYILPKKFKVPLRNYKLVAPIAEVSLLDDNNKVLDNKTYLINFNAIPSMFYNEEMSEYNPYARKNGESTIFYLKNIGRYNNDFHSDWCVLAPYASVHQWADSTIKLSQTIDVIFYLTPDTLSKVRSVKIGVNVKNSRMDNAFESMEKEIDLIPTK